MTQDFFLYVDPTDYSRDAEGMFQCCYDEVVAEAKDTGDYPMYGEAMLIQSAKWKQEDLVDYITDKTGWCISSIRYCPNRPHPLTAYK